MMQNAEGIHHDEIVVGIVGPYDSDDLWYLRGCSESHSVDIESWIKVVGQHVGKNEPMIRMKSTRYPKLRFHLHAPEAGILKHQWGAPGESITAMKVLGTLSTTEEEIRRNRNIVCDHPIYDEAAMAVKRNWKLLFDRKRVVSNLRKENALRRELDRSASLSKYRNWKYGDLLRDALKEHSVAVD